MATFPEQALAWVNGLLVAVFDGVFTLLGPLPPLLGVTAVSVITGVAMLGVVARTSDQSAMAEAKRRMQAGLLEVRLLNDDPAAVLRALGDLLLANLRYLRLSLVPLAWMIVPITLVIAQVQSFYGYDGLDVGAPVLLSVDAAPESAAAGHEPLTLDAPPELRLDTPAVRLQESNEVIWRLVPTAAGSYAVTFRSGSRTATKQIEVGTGIRRRSPRRGAPALVDQLLYPSEPPLSADSPVTRIGVPYPEPGLDVFGWRVHWLVAFVVLSTVAAFGFARRFGVVL
ncbi:MAG: hypothetical protein R2712_04425 [Vicinamibacterales bacterium]